MSHMSDIDDMLNNVSEGNEWANCTVLWLDSLPVASAENIQRTPSLLQPLTNCWEKLRRFLLRLFSDVSRRHTPMSDSSALNRLPVKQKKRNLPCVSWQE